MAREFTETIDISTDHVAVTGAETVVYDIADNPEFPDGLTGGLLGIKNTLRFTCQTKLSLNAGASLTVNLNYGAMTASITLIVVDAIVDLPLMIEALLSADGSVNLQRATLVGFLADVLENWMASTSVGGNTGTEDSASDIPLTISFVVSGTGSATKEHVTVERISFIEESEIPESAAPDTMIYSVGILCRLPHLLFKKVTFYAELFHHLDYLGVGPAVYTRTGSSTAVWNDGGSHAVAANVPRFEYSAGVPLGLRINVGDGGESITFPIANALNSANTLFWKEDGVLKVTPANTNPINGSGVWTGTNNIHISHMLKFSVVLSAAEIAMVSSILNGPNYIV